MWAVLGHAFSVGVCLWVSKPGKSLVLEKVTYLYECVRLGKGFLNFSHGQSDLTTKSYHFIMQGMLQCYSIHISSLSLFRVITDSQRQHKTQGESNFHLQTRVERKGKVQSSFVSVLPIEVKFVTLEFCWAFQTWTNKVQVLKTGQGSETTLGNLQVIVFREEQGTWKIILFDYLLHFLVDLETCFSWLQRHMGRTELPVCESTRVRLGANIDLK